MQATATKRVARIEAHLTPKISSIEAAGCAAAALELPDVSNGPAVMASERSQASFNVREVTHLLDGSERGTQRKHAAYELVRNEPVFIDPGYYDRTRDEGTLTIPASPPHKRRVGLSGPLTLRLGGQLLCSEVPRDAEAQALC
jgi:hypothetical protein